MRRVTAALIAVLALTLLAAPVVAQAVISASDPSFSWTGKEGQQANYRWSATVTNPSRRATTVEVTLQLLDGAGDVVAADSQTIEVARQSEASAGGESSLPYADAARATQYRVMVAGTGN